MTTVLASYTPPPPHPPPLVHPGLPSPPPPPPPAPNGTHPDPSCFNATVFEQYIRGLVNNVTVDEKSSRARRREVEGDPLVYIVAVLLFYSCGIAVLMINYMKKEQHDEAETTLYKEYVDKRGRCSNDATPSGGGGGFGGSGGGGGGGGGARTGGLNRLALTALNAVNVISQDGDQSSRVAFV